MICRLFASLSDIVEHLSYILFPLISIASAITGGSRSVRVAGTVDADRVGCGMPLRSLHVVVQGNCVKRSARCTSISLQSKLREGEELRTFTEGGAVGSKRHSQRPAKILKQTQKATEVLRFDWPWCGAGERRRRRDLSRSERISDCWCPLCV